MTQLVGGALRGRADRAHSGRRQALARLEGDRRRVRQLVEPRVPQVVAPKRIGLAVFAEKRPGAPVPLESDDGAGHTLWPTCFSRCLRACTRAAMSSAMTGSPLIVLALIRRLSSARVKRKSLAVKSWRVCSTPSSSGSVVTMSGSSFWTLLLPGAEARGYPGRRLCCLRFVEGGTRPFSHR